MAHLIIISKIRWTGDRDVYFVRKIIVTITISLEVETQNLEICVDSLALYKLYDVLFS